MFGLNELKLLNDYTAVKLRLNVEMRVIVVVVNVEMRVEMVMEIYSHNKKL